MPMLITSKCPCCRDFLHHCKKCWNEFHNGEKDKDYIEPEHYGQRMDKTGKVDEKMKELDCYREPSIEENKNRKYVEGEYH